MYAIIESGGKQYRVAPGQSIDVDRLDVVEGGTIELDRVLLVADNDKVTIGTPTIEGAKIVATAVEEFKGDKIIVFKYKPKVRYQKKTGHRQIYTRLTIDEIITPGAKKARPTKKAGRSKKEVREDGP